MGDAIEIASSKTKGMGFSWRALILVAVTLAMLIPSLYFIATPIRGGPLSYNETQTLQTMCCSGGSPLALVSVAEITLGSGTILFFLLYSYTYFALQAKSNFSSFWERIEKSK